MNWWGHHFLFDNCHQKVVAN